MLELTNELVGSRQIAQGISMLYEFKPDPNDDLYEKVQRAEYVCIATSFEKSSLYARNHDMYKDEWIQDVNGRGITIGKCGNDPVSLSLSWAKVRNVNVLFVDPISQVVDFRMIDEWLQQHCNGARTDGSDYIQKADTMNFSPRKPTRTARTKHVSFDVWNTLVKGNPLFAKARLEAISKHWDLPAAVAPQVKAAYTSAKQTLDWLAERQGVAYSCNDVYDLLSAKLGLPKQTTENLDTVRKLVNQEFINHPPIYNTETVLALQELRAAGFTLSIGSNSNFISGDVMFPWLNEVFGEFKFGVFSDLIGAGKPSPNFFNEVAKQAHQQASIWERKHIVHVGDHIVCDVQGAKDAGMRYAFITGVDAIPLTVEELIKGS